MLKFVIGLFDREYFFLYLEKEVLEYKDREDYVFYIGEKKGKYRILKLLFDSI